MQIKKAVLKARVQRRINELNKEKAEYEAKLPAYMKALVKYHKALLAQVEKAGDSYEAYNKMPRVDAPQKPVLYYRWSDNMRAANRNIAILDALDGDLIEVGKLKGGRDFQLDGLFEDSF